MQHTSPTQSQQPPTAKPSSAASGQQQATGVVTPSPASSSASTPVSAAAAAADRSTPAAPAGSSIQQRYGMSISEQDKAARERATRESVRYPYSGPTPTGPRPDSMSTPAAGHSHSTSAPHHHHHHNHHHHHHVLPHTSGSATPSGQSSSTPSIQSTHDANRVPGSGLSSGYPSSRHETGGLTSGSSAGATQTASSRPFGGSYSSFGSYLQDQKRERELLRQRDIERDIEKQKEHERQQKAAGGGQADQSPGRAPPSLYSRAPISTSPSLSRPHPTPVNSSAAKSSSSSQPPVASAPPSSSRPNLPLPGFASLGTRALPSPFEGRDRPGSGNTSAGADPTPNRQRTLSGGSQPRDSLGLTSLGQISPGKSAQPSPVSSRGLYGGPAPNSRDSVAIPQRSPVARNSAVSASPTQTTREPATSTATATSSTKPTTSGASSSATSQSQRPSYSFSSTYASVYTAPYNSYGLGGSFMGGSGFPFGFSQQEREQRERAREREKGLEKEREKQDRDREKDREREIVRERDRKERERLDQLRVEKEREQQRRLAYGVESKPFQPPRQPSTYTDIYRPRQPAPAQSVYPEPKFTRHIEVINRPESAGYQAATTENASATSTTAPSAAPPAPPSVAVQQAPPSREVRPYGYAKVEPRDYGYQPRDKRPRMDAAVEDQAQAHRRVSTNRTKRRKDDDKKSPVAATQRDWSALTVAVKKQPEVSSSRVEAWLKTVSDIKRIASYEVYGGSNWALSQTEATNPDCEGAVVMVRINGGFLGSKWKVRGEQGWDESSPSGEVGSVIGLGWEEGGPSRTKRQIWGTDVYTDDSDLGLVLIHAGWVRWGGPPSHDDAAIEVKVRIVPPLVRYTATERNGVITRGWGNGHDGSSIVIEDAKRVMMDHKYVSQIPRRAKMKMTMAENARQRAIAFDAIAPPPSIMPEVISGAAASSPDANELVFIAGQAGYSYSITALERYLDQPGHDENEPHSLWTRDLEFGTATDRYRLTLIVPEADNNEGPRLAISCINRKGEEMIASSLDPKKAFWIKQGLALETSSKNGTLCLAQVYRWVRRSPVDTALATAATDVVGTEVEAELGNAKMIVVDTVSAVAT